jgi:hypothetical protein
MILTNEQKIEARNEFITLASTFIDLKENTEEGKKHVQKFLASVGLTGNLPWCAAFICYCLKEIEKKYGPSGVFQSAGVVNIWTKTPHDLKVKVPETGSIVIYQSQANGKLTTTGHAGIVLKHPKPNFFISLEGNTSDGSNINRDGDGVYKKMRPFPSTYKTLVLRGFILPWK